MSGWFSSLPAICVEACSNNGVSTNTFTVCYSGPPVLNLTATSQCGNTTLLIAIDNILDIISRFDSVQVVRRVNIPMC